MLKPKFCGKSVNFRGYFVVPSLGERPPPRQMRKEEELMIDFGACDLVSKPSDEVCSFAEYGNKLISCIQYCVLYILLV